MTAGEPVRVYRAITVKDLKDVPSEHELSHVYIIGHLNKVTMAVMKCPCECGDTIKLNLSPAVTPLWAWNVNPKWGEVTFGPSIQRMVGCLSHFFIRDGQLSWCHKPTTS